MKRKILIGIILICVLLIGCNKSKEDKNEMIVGGWETVLTDKMVVSDDILTIFNKAKNDYKDLKLDAVALLGKQVVAGTNYMFLAKGYQKNEENKATYKIVIIYNNLENKATITKVVDFDYTKYVNEYIDGGDEELVGGWFTESPKNLGRLEDSIQTSFDEATSTLTGMTYKPIAVIGKQIVSGTNYAILCFGGASYNNSKEGIYLVTLYEDLSNTNGIVGSVYIDLAEFNK